MPGDIPLCGSCRRTEGLGIFKLPSIKKEASAGTGEKSGWAKF